MEHELDPSASLLSLSSQLSDAADDICEAEHVTLLRRRFASPESQAVLAAGVNGGGALVAQRVSQLNRLKQEQELDELRSSLAEAKAQADQERARASRLEEQVQLLAASRSSKACVEAASETAPLPVQPRDPSKNGKAPAPPIVTTATHETPEATSSPQQLVHQLHRDKIEAVGGAGGGALVALVGRALQALSRDLYSGAGAVLGEPRSGSNSELASYHPCCR